MLLLQIEQSKRELIWFLIKKGGEFPIKEYGEDFKELPFDIMELQDFLHELVSNENSGKKIYDLVSSVYDEMVADDKEKWKNRIDFISVIGNKNINLNYS